MTLNSQVQEQHRRELRKDFTTLTAGLSAVPFDRSNPVAAAGLDARTRLLERIQPRITSVHDSDNGSTASNGLNGRPAASAQMTPIQRLKAVAEAEVSNIAPVLPSRSKQLPDELISGHHIVLSGCYTCIKQKSHR